MDPNEPAPEPDPAPEPEPAPEPDPEPTLRIQSFPIPFSTFVHLMMNNPPIVGGSLGRPPAEGSLEERVTNQSFHQNAKYKKVCSKEFMKSLSVQKVDEELVTKKVTCSLCMDDLQRGEDVIVLPCKDKHYFHIRKNECPGIYPWLEDNNTCPMCRYEFPSIDKEINHNEQVTESHPIRPLNIQSIISQAIEDEEERMLQEVLYNSLQ